MANVDSAFGLRPVRTLSGAPWTGQTIECVIPSSDGTATFLGDAVKLSGTADTGDENGAPTVIQAAAGDVVFGVIVGFRPDYTDLTQKYRTASTRRVVQVCPATADVVFEVQADAAFQAANVGQLFDVVVGSGDTTTGKSAMELDVGTAGTSDGQLRAIGITRAPDLDFDASNAGVNVEVVVNESVFHANVAGV